ncbi:MAG: DEAD/DEAH box helicase [Verrucomicrobiales bacterium]
MAGFAAVPAFSLQLPDIWQQQAVRHLKAKRDVILDAPTGAGKTYVFESLVESRALRGQAIYTVPTRALANDKRIEWHRRGWRIGIATGDVAENLDAPVVVATLETQRERFIEGRGPALLVIDEYQMIADEVRGLSYELSIALAPLSTQLLLMSGSVGNPGDVQSWLQRIGRNCAVVSTSERPVPLDELPHESLPHKAPARITGFWPRAAVEVLMADLGPLLIFAPRRSQAEKIARAIAQALPHDDPLHLTEAQQHVCGKELSAVLEKRVAWHHSGLTYQQRAGIIEPLAKAGKLRVVVATMGLAAGINFSMRSVIVSETRYFDGRNEREIARDELLQMFGRAGRRGLDATGYVVVTDHSPRLSDAAPLRLKRGRDLDWPPLLRVMHRAAARGEPPFEAAEKLSASLFSTSAIDLGLSKVAEPASRPETPALFGLVPTRREILNSRGEWEEHDATRLTTGPLEEAFVFHRQHLEAALENYNFVASRLNVGRVCRLDTEGRRILGKEVALAMQNADDARFGLTRNVRAWLKQSRQERFTYDQLEQQVVPRLSPHLEGGQVVGLVQRGEVLALLLDFSRLTVPVYRDSYDVLLVNAEEREAPIERPANVRDPAGGGELQARPGTAAYAWRKLGLIEADGSPTRRGIVCSFFQHGEGLAIAAALEDKSLPIDELVVLLANIRAGSRFSTANEGGADRLANACRDAYGTVDFEGYLNLGLPPSYGEGASELVADLLVARAQARRRVDEYIGQGDIERAFIEWLSLLRHLGHAPDFDWPRWQELKAAAAVELAKYAHLSPNRTLPEVPAVQLVHRVDHVLTHAKLRR